MKSNGFIFKTLGIAALVLCVQTALSAQNPDFPALDTLPVLDSLPEYQVRDLALRLSSQAAGIREVLVSQADRAALEREVATDQLAACKADTLADKEEQKTLGKILKTAKNTEKNALKQVKKADQALALATKVADMDSAALYKNLPKAYKSVAALIPPPEVPKETPIAEVIGTVGVTDPVDLADIAVQADTVAIDTVAVDSAATTTESQPAKKEKKQAPARPEFKTYKASEDVLLNPPPRPCVLTADSRDEFSGERRRETQKEELFRYTNPSLKSYFPDREHIICQASMAMNGGTYVLSLSFTINDVNARRAFGSLPRNGVAVLKLLNGETFTLYNLRLDEGKASDDNQSFVFNGQYVVDGGMLKKMQKNLFDKIRIAWSTGYEDYEVQNVDFLARQLNCLLKN